MEKVDEKDVQSFKELQRRMISIAEQQRGAQSQESIATQALRKAYLTATELESLDDVTPTYAVAGKAFFLMPKNQVMSDLESHAKTRSADLKRLKEMQQGLQASMTAVEHELKELLSNCQGLAQAFASQ